jgi:Ser-tRNA(Ala) deacylase AlaX
MATSTLISEVTDIAESIATVSADLRMEMIDLEESGDSYSGRIDRQRKAKLASLRTALMLEHLAKRLRKCAS